MVRLPEDEFDVVFGDGRPIEEAQMISEQGSPEQSVAPPTSENTLGVSAPVAPTEEAAQLEQGAVIPTPSLAATSEIIPTQVERPLETSLDEPSVLAPEPTQMLPKEPQAVDVLTGLLEQVKEDPEIRSYLDEYPEIAGPQMKLLAKTVEKVVGTIANELDKRESLLAQSVHPVLKDYYQRQEQAHYDKILSAHPQAADWVSSGAVERWINQQPKFAREAFMTVYSQGGADDVIDLLNQFAAANVPINPPTQKQEQMMIQEAQQQEQLEASQERGPAPPGVMTLQQPIPPEILQEKTSTLSPEDQQKLAMIEAVKRKGVAEPKTSKVVDFDSAFEEAIRGLT